MAPPRTYLPRLIDASLDELFGGLPAIQLVGPRGVGKTTAAARLAKDVVRLDRAQESEAFRVDPDAALKDRQEPLLLDEWQQVPEVIGAVKRAVDEDFRPGRFILTGSVRARWRGGMWPATGRVVSVAMGGVTQREIEGALDGPGFVERAVDAPKSLMVRPTWNLPQYLDLAARGMFPPLALGEITGKAVLPWLRGHIEEVVSQDVEGDSQRLDFERMRVYLSAVALNTAGVPTSVSLAEAAGVSVTTARDYDDRLARVFAVTTVPAWSTNRLKRLTRAGKRYVLDPAVAMAAAGVTPQQVFRSGDLMGRYLDTLVHAQLWPEQTMGPGAPGLFHLRTEQGRHEVDLIAEHEGRVVGIEVKAGGVVTARDARHLAWLRDQLGDQFARGVVLHTGPGAYEVGERILAVPIAALWTTRQ